MSHVAIWRETMPGERISKCEVHDFQYSLMNTTVAICPEQSKWGTGATLGDKVREVFVRQGKLGRVVRPF